MDTNSDVYDYDKSTFFRIISQSQKFRLKYEFIQQHQGLVVCPLRFPATQAALADPDIIDRHLFVPSPFYKNHYIPLNSLSSISSLSASNFYSLPLDHSQKVNLIINDYSDNNSAAPANPNDDFVLLNGRKRICKNVKLFNTQTAYSETGKIYKILIVNRPLYFKRPQQSSQNSSSSRLNYNFSQSTLASNHATTQSSSSTTAAHSSSNNVTSDNDDELDELDDDESHSNSGVQNVAGYDDVMDDDENRANQTRRQSQFNRSAPFQQRRRSGGYIPAVSHRNSTFMRPAAFESVNDVKTYRESIEFMHDTVTLVNLNDDDENASNRQQDQGENEIESDWPQRRPAFVEAIIGEELLREMDLFRKTYIILSTHMNDCVAHLERIYRKYVRKFLKSFANLNGGTGGANAAIELMISVACENAIVGHVFPKIWPIIGRLNRTGDDAALMRCKQLSHQLKLEEAEQREEGEWVKNSSRFFQIDAKYFLINFRPILKELSRLPLYNNPFEMLECIKSTLDLLTNELAISSSTSKSATASMATSSSSSNIGDSNSSPLSPKVHLSPSAPNLAELEANERQEAKEQSTTILSSTYLTSEILIPLLSFLLVISKIECLQSIVYFIDKFQFSYKPDPDHPYSATVNSTFLGELAYFMTTFRASVEFLINSTSA